MKRFLPALAAVAVLALSGCGSSSSDESLLDKTPTTSAASSSASASPTSSPSPAKTSASPTPTAEETSAEPTTEPSAEPTSEAPKEAPASEAKQGGAPQTNLTGSGSALVEPGTRCDDGSAYVPYVFGGTVSCDEAIKYMDGLRNTPPQSQGWTITYAEDGYECSFDRAPQHQGAYNSYGICRNAANGAYIETKPAWMNILPGHVADPKEYYSAGSSYDVAFKSPDQSVSCAGSISQGMSCATVSAQQGDPSAVDIVTANVRVDPSTGAITAPVTARETRSQDVTPEMSAAQKVLDAGTTMNVVGVSCRSDSDSAVICVAPNSTGFTISRDGVTKF